MGFFPYSTQNYQLKILSIASLEQIAKIRLTNNSTYMAYSYQFCEWKPWNENFTGGKITAISEKFTS